MNLEPTAEEAAELLAAAVMGLNDPEVRWSNVGPGVSTQISQIFSADSSKLTVKKLKKMNEDEVSLQFLGGGYAGSFRFGVFVSRI